MAVTISASSADSVKQNIIEYLHRVPFDRAIEQKEFQELLRQDAALPPKDRLIPPDALVAFQEARELRHAKRTNAVPSAFFNNKSVLIVPGFLGSQLLDDGPAGNGLIWISPTIYTNPAKVSALRLAPYDPAAWDHDADANVHIREDSSLPVVYSGLWYYLESGRCEVRIAGFDWRKDIDDSAARLVETIRSFANEHPGRPFFLIAHSQGSLVARRALQLLGKETARRMVNRLILLGPASYGTFAAAFAIAGSHETITTFANWGLNWPADLTDVLQSMSGLYQLLPWKPDTIDSSMDPAAMSEASFWASGCDPVRLEKYFKWGASVDTTFFNDRTSIILGDDPKTPDAAKFVAGKLVASHTTQGDGTVPDRCALLEGVQDVGRAAGAAHGSMPLNRQVMQTVWRIINANLSVQALRGGQPIAGEKIVPLPAPVDLFALAGMRRPGKTPAPHVPTKKTAAPPAGKKAAQALTPLVSAYGDAPPVPKSRRLKVFSFDPLLATDPGAMGMESIVLNLDWDEESADGAKLQPGPIGEYLEVIDYDPASRCFYPPVNLNDPNLLAQDGWPMSETEPRFHQQMVYAVAMATISVFERALGRSVLWSPNLIRDEEGKVISDGSRSIGGLESGSVYYAIVDPKFPGWVRLAKNPTDAKARKAIQFEKPGIGRTHSLTTLGPPLSFTLPAAPASTAHAIDVGCEHNLKTGQCIVYDHGRNRSIGGLTGGRVYHAVIDPNRPSVLMIADTLSNANAGNTLALDLATVSGKHSFFAVDEAYSRFNSETGVDVEKNSINLGNEHPFQTSQPLVYDKGSQSEFVRRLRIYPHAMREANAYYDPQRKSLLFGYFPARAQVGGKVMPKGTIFTCLSFDVVAHETTHAILDGVHRHLLDASNPDVLAFHEAFADVVALFQHFSHPGVVRGQVAKVAGKLENENMLGQLAQQFGEAMNMHSSLRNYLGKKDDDGVWKPVVPDATLYESIREPHDRGALLVAAMFTAFLTIYRSRTRDLLRIATKGTGLIPDGDIHPDLVGRLASEASKAARHLLIMAIRALDYIPPVDMTFGDYLRGLITSDFDLVAADTRYYRVAIVDAFRQWGIYPNHVKTLSVDSVIWNSPERASLKLDMEHFRDLIAVTNGNLDLDRADLYQHQRKSQMDLHKWMRAQFAADPKLAEEWGLAVAADAPHTIERDKGGMPKFDIHSVRRCRRIGPDDQERIDVLIEVIQRRAGYLDEKDQESANKGNPPAGGPDFIFRGGATLIVDPRAGRIRYAIRNSILNEERLARNRDFYGNHGGALGLSGNYFGDGGNPFPHLHGSDE